jgi:hypothetical protein
METTVNKTPAPSTLISVFDLRPMMSPVLAMKNPQKLAMYFFNGFGAGFSKSCGKSPHSNAQSPVTFTSRVSAL